MSRSRTSPPSSHLFALFFAAFVVLPGFSAASSATPPAQLLSLGNCLSTDDAGTDGSAVVLSSCVGRPGQNWQLPPRGFSGPIVDSHGKCLDVTGSNPADRTPIILFSCHGLPNQVWRHELDGRVVGLGDKCLDVLGSGTTDGTPIVLFTCNSTPNQLWTAQQRNHFHSEPLLSEAWLTALAASPQKPDRIFAAASTNGILRSENGGVDWAGAHRGVSLGTGVQEIVVDPQRADEVYALENGRLLRSSDGGRHFFKYLGTPGNLRHIAIDPRRAGRVISTDGDRIFESLDSGRYFTQRDFPFQQSSGTVQQLIFDPQTPNRWWIAAASTCAFCTGPDQGVFRSDDEGNTWTRVFTSPTQRVVADPSGNGHIYALVNAQLHRSINGGTTWQLLSVFPAPLLDMWVDSTFAGRLVVAHQHGLARSADGGASFVPVTFDPALRIGPSGFPVEVVRHLLFTGGRLLAAVDAIDGHPGRGVIASSDFGATWTLRSQRLFAAGHVADLDTVPGQNKTLWVASREGVFQSTDGGVRFSKRLATTGPGEATALLVDPYDPSGQTLFVAATRFPGPADSFLWKSTNGGTSWTSVAANFGQQIETGGFLATRVAGKRTYMTTLNGRIGSTDYKGLLVSDNENGTSWKPIDLGVRVNFLAKGDDDLVLFAAGDALLRSLSGGQTWNSIFGQKVEALTTRGAELHFVTETAYCSSPDRGQVITCYPLPRAIHGARSVLVAGGLSYVGDRAGGVFASTDLGRSWTAVDLGLPATLINVMMVDPQDPARLYVGTAGAGLHQTLVSLPEAPLPFAEGRFTATITWRDFLGATGSGQAKSWTEDSGYFWFFDPNNVEVMVKVLDGREFNDRYWVFVGSLSNVEFELTIRDEWTGQVRVYRNPLGTFASFGDIDAFPGGVTNLAATGTPAVPEGSPTTAAAFKPEAAALKPEAARAAPIVIGNNRFEITVSWEDGFGQNGEGVGVTMSSDTAAFSFFSPNNTELVIKVLDGRLINGRFWVFYGALSNVGYTIRIQDRATGQQVIYQNPVGTFASVGDISAF